MGMMRIPRLDLLSPPVDPFNWIISLRYPPSALRIAVVKTSLLSSASHHLVPSNTGQVELSVQ